jgi:hypothetical protein
MNLARLAAVALVVAGAADAWVALRRDPTAPPAAAVAEASAWIEARRAPGEAVVLSPLLSPESLASLPAGRGGPSVPAAQGRVFVLDFGPPVFVPGRPLERRAFDHGLLVRVVERGRQDRPGGAVFDLVRDLDSSTLRVERDGRRRACDRPRSPAGFACPGEAEWVYAAPESLTIGGRRRTCIWAHPITDATVIFELPAPPDVDGAPAPPGPPWELRLGAGLSDRAVMMKDGAPVHLRVEQAGKVRGRLRIPNRSGWRTATVPLDAETPVEVRIDTRFDGMRHHCITAEIRPRSRP